MENPQLVFLPSSLPPSLPSTSLLPSVGTSMVPSSYTSLLHVHGWRDWTRILDVQGTVVINLVPLLKLVA